MTPCGNLFVRRQTRSPHLPLPAQGYMALRTPHFVGIPLSFVFLLLLGILAGCSTPPPHEPTPEALAARGGAFRRAARKAYEAGNYPQALRLARSAVGEDRTDAESHYLLALIYDKLDRFQEAMASYRETLRWNGNHAGAYIGICAIFYYEGRYPRAAQACETAHALAPRDTVPLRLLVLIYHELGEPQRAFEAERMADRLPQGRFDRKGANGS
ncbi:MAG: tetratricopeptide repeat protein [Deltaproteobacteria bacterium]|nr:MAG: tetratricopeptide repeat protein [Deltaproteobacteria bacterium]